MYSRQPYYQEDIDYINQLDLPWEELENATILITGASGLIATFIIDALMKRNKELSNSIKVIALSRSREKLEERFLEYKDVTILAQDVCQEIEISEKIDYIIHAACDTQPMLRYNNPVDIIRTSTEGMNQICELGRKLLVKKIILISTAGIHGDQPRECEAFGETDMGYIDCWSFQSAYNGAKRITETLAVSYVHQYGLDISAIRLCKVFGPTCHRTDGLVPTQFMLKAVNDEEIVMKSNGQQVYSYAYVPDAAAGILYTLLKGGKGEVYDLGDGYEKEAPTLNEYVSYLATQFNVKVIYQQKPDDDDKIYSNAVRFITKSCKLKELGWSKKYSIKEGLFRSVTIMKDEMKLNITKD